MKRKPRLPALDQMVAASAFLMKGDESKALAMLYRAIKDKSIIASLKVIADANDESLDLSLEEDTSDEVEGAGESQTAIDTIKDFEEEYSGISSDSEFDIELKINHNSDSDDEDATSDELELSEFEAASFKLNRRTSKILANASEDEDASENEDEDEDDAEIEGDEISEDSDIDYLLASLESEEDDIVEDETEEDELQETAKLSRAEKNRLALFGK